MPAPLAALAAPSHALAVVPMSATAAELLHRLQQEAAEAAAPAPGTIVLEPAGKSWGPTRADSTSIYTDADGAHTYLYRTWRYAAATWTGQESRRDLEGRRWERRIEAVMDDFGDLVEVAS